MKKLLINDIKWFVLIILASIIAWTSVFSILNKPKDYETLKLFISTSSFSEEKINEHLNNEEQYKDVIIHGLDITNENYTASLQTNGVLYSDILVLNEDVLEFEGIDNAFVKLENNYLSQYGIDLNDYELIYVNETPIGIVIYDGTTNLLSEYMTFGGNSKYFLCLNTESYHVDKYSVKEKNVSNKAFETLAALLK